jgi:hypothetical protein
MDEKLQAKLLCDLHEGRTSRNRDYAEFLKPDSSRVLHGYRRLRSLARELCRPDVEVRLHRSRGGAEPAVEILIRGLGYHRLVLLTPWEFEFLRTEMGVHAILPREF